MSAPRYVQLINMGGDHCGMGLTNDYPDGHEDAATRSRADDSEWIKASDHDDVVRELVEALEFYADRKFTGYEVDISDYGLSMSKGEIVLDEGDIARAALAKIAQDA